MAPERNEEAAAGRGAAGTRRVYCETVPLEELARPTVIELLARRGVQPIVAVRPFDAMDAAARVLAEARRAGLAPAVWPMLADEDGRWCSADNVDAFAGFAAAAVEELARRGAPPVELWVDLEPPVSRVRAAFVAPEQGSLAERAVNAFRP
ncbi:MAG TPA: hypothetical protein VHB21_27250, partial [Minicystis sp.]|nr:hypothetical protein [Minicystis sp.]